MPAVPLSEVGCGPWADTGFGFTICFEMTGDALTGNVVSDPVKGIIQLLAVDR